jgi:hypothetical protein
MADLNDLDWVRSEIASDIGRPEAHWDQRTSFAVEAAIKRGIDSVIHNPQSHQWSWMRPTFRFTTADNQRRYALPADFEQFVGDLSFDGENYQYPPITQLPASRLQQLNSDYNNTSVPCYYALEVQPHDGTTPQQREFTLHPTPDGVYQLVAIYQVGPIRSLSTQRPWFPGGPEFRELFVAACLAAVESDFTGIAGHRQERFETVLQGAINRDYGKAAKNLGPMGGTPYGPYGPYGLAAARDYYRHKLPTTYNGGAQSF